MVCVGEEERVSKSMAMGRERSRALHNFDLPCLKWGNQRLLRCMKENSGGGALDGEADHQQSVAFGFERTPVSQRRRVFEPERRRFRVPKPRTDSGEEEEGIEAVREKLMSDLKTAANKLKDAILRDEIVVAEGEDADNDAAPVEVSPESAPAPSIALDLRPWNLRTRRVACKSSNGGGVKGLRFEERKPNNSPLRSEGNNGVKSPRPVRGLPENKERPKFRVALTRKEIDEDFMEILGHRPPRRPKKRPRMVQKQLDCLFPGLWLTEVTADSYKVPEFPENCKR